MIARVVIAVVLVAAIAGGAYLALSGGKEPLRYTVVLDNSFGLTEGADLRVAGVRAGKVEKLDVERSTARALVTVAVTKPSFGRFRRDVFCKVVPQSLIGEYFLNCDPGTSGEMMADGGTVPVERTMGTVPADLVQNILTKPYRERLAIILTELGAGFAARGDDLNATVQRAIPALRETDEVLRILSNRRQELVSLQRNGATVLSRLAAQRDDVASFVAEARDTARASAERREDIAGTFRRFPSFLRELRPTLADLGTAARRQTPALADLRASAGDLDAFFERLGPFSEASRPFVRSTGRAAETGTEAVTAARPTVQRLRELAANGAEPLKNLRFVAEHLEDRDFAIEENPLSPTGRGFTGLEAFLQYPFVQSQAINIFDDRGYLLKIALLANECDSYTNAESAREDPGRTERCSQAIGPNQPGVNQPDPSPGAAASAASASAAQRRAAATASAETGGRAAGQPASDASTEALLDYLLAP